MNYSDIPATYHPEPRFRWPDGHRCAVMLSFDVDGETTALAENPAHAMRLTTMSMCEYGPKVGVPNLLGLLDHLQVPATFFIPSYIIERHPGMTREIAARGYEIGLHGHLHERLPHLSEAEERSILARSREILRHVTGLEASGYRAPWFELNTRTPEILKEAGVFYCSSAMGDDVPYRHPNGLLEIPIQWVLEDWEQFAFNAEPAWGVIPETCDKVFTLWLREFEAAYQFGTCMSLILHPWLSGHPARLQLLERLVRTMQDHPGVWFATGSQIAEWFDQNPDARREVDLK